ncbi:MAG: hypothetical protein WC637_12445 [Victivallales bacterium]
MKILDALVGSPSAQELHNTEQTLGVPGNAKRLLGLINMRKDFRPTNLVSSLFAFLTPDTRHLLSLICLLFASSAFAQNLEFAGVLGNSGISGDTLVRVNTAMKGRDGSGLNCGIYLDKNARIWLSGGDAVNCLDFEGRLVKRFPLQPLGSRIDTTAFAVLDGVLYSFGHLAKPNPKTRSDVALFALPLSGADTVEAVAEFAEYQSHQTGIICPTTHNGKLVYAFPEEKEGLKKIIIAAFDPKNKKRERMLEIPGHWPAGLAIDKTGEFLYLGGYFGKYVGGSVHQPNACEIVKLAWDGKETWRRLRLETPAEPTAFRGVVSYAGGAIWDAAWYGFLARFDLDGKSSPGKVASWDMRISYVSQIVDVRESLKLLPPRGLAAAMDPLLISNHSPEHSYFAAWDDDAHKLNLEKRYGSLPELGNISLNADGWVNAGGLWWRFEDSANSAPSFANHTAATSPGAWRGEWLCSMTTGDKVIPVVGRPAFGRQSAQSSQDMVTPFKQIRGFTVDNSKSVPDPIAFSTEGETRKIWRSKMEPRLWAPRKEWKALTAETITDPGDIAVLADGILLVVDGGSIVKLEESGDTLKEKLRLSQWGDSPDKKFGAKLRMSADGNRILVSDTARHRVVLVDASTFKPCAQFGITDKEGSSENQLDSPGSVDLAGNRAIVADMKNQRIVKLLLIE